MGAAAAGRRRIVLWMVPLAFALHLALLSTDPGAPAVATLPDPADAPEGDPGSAPAARPEVAAAVPDGAPAAALAPPSRPRLSALTLAPRQLDPGPFRAGEVTGAALGAFAGDALVIGAGYLALRLFADGTLSPTATNFRRAVYALGVSALVVPPLTGVLVAKLVGGPHARGGFWKAMLLASAGEVAALAAGYYAAPRFWVVLPVQAIVLSLGASFGLHWGSHARADETRDAAPDAGPPPLAPAPETTAGIATPICPDA